MHIRRTGNRGRRSGRILATLVIVVAAAGVGLGVGAVLWRSGAHGPSDGASAGGQSPSAGMKTLYTCGMHPEIIQDEPGNCPKCEMRLTPMDPDRARAILEARGESVAEPAAGVERRILYWRAPMDPAYIRNEPGKSPMGMDLVPVYEDEVRGGPTIRIDPVTEQNMGVRYGEVRLGPLEQTVRSVGIVAYDEQSLGAATTKVSGWVEKVHVDQTGAQVHAGDPLFELYSPELFSAQEEFLVAHRDLIQARDRGSDNAIGLAERRLRLSRDRLRLFDIGEDQIERLENGQDIQKTLTIPSRLTGIVTEKMVKEGDYLEAGTPAYQIADISTVWVIGKVFESDAGFVKVGQEALMTLDYLPGRTYRGRVTYIYPYLENDTRETPVRMEFHNPGYDLKPNMYATIEIHSRLADEAVLVADTAVIRTGTRDVAFVMREPGKFEPREVKIGVRTSTHDYQVLSGLAPGDRVVISGQFLLDSESRLREAAVKMYQPGLRDAGAFETGAPGDERAAGSPGAAGDLKYVCPMPAHTGVLYDDSGDCPLCKMRLVPVQAWPLDDSPLAYYTCPMPEHASVHEDNPGKCPLCGMTLIPMTARDVERLAQAEAATSGTVAEQMEMDLPELYTCPMASHAHIVSDQAGKCPECEMTLVPATSVAHEAQAVEAWRKGHEE